MSDVAVDLGRCYDRTILRQMNVNGVGDIQCQEHGEMDSLSKLHAKLAVSFFCTRNTKAIFVHNEVVRFDLHVVEVSDIRFKVADCGVKHLDATIQGTKPGHRIIDFVVKSL